jgi:RNA polymerase sigma-70 factor (ECF subfamily)
LTIVRNTCYDRLRKNRRLTPLAAPEELDRACDDRLPSPEAEQLRLADERMLQEGLAALPAEYRETLVLRELEGMPYREIAQVTGVPIGTVMSRLARGRKRLGDALKEKTVGLP